MFKLQPKPTFWATVSISVPGQDKPSAIQVQFNHLGREAMKIYFDGLQDGQDDAAALLTIVSGWKGVDAEFSPESLATLIDNYPSAAKAMFEAFTRETLEAKSKN